MKQSKKNSDRPCPLTLPGVALFNHITPTAIYTLADSLSLPGALPIYTERVDDYVSFHHILHELLDDIEQNGTMTTDSKTGEIVPRKSVCEAIKASRELGKIYQELDFTALAKKRQGPDGPEDEL